MLAKLGWAVWALVPVAAMAYHFGPGQERVKLDRAATLLQTAHEADARAMELQSGAHAAQLATFEARKRALLSGEAADAAAAESALVREQAAYAEASAAWKQAADHYASVQTELGPQGASDAVGWAQARALVRSGEVFNGINELQSVIDRVEASGASEGEIALAAREEQAAAYYYGARLLREEGKPAAEWLAATETARQQYRYLAERAIRIGDELLSVSLQHNLERVLDLEQLGYDDMVGQPLPKDSPRCRRPGDCESGNCKGKGKKKGDKPGNGAGPLMEIGPGW